LAVGGETRGRKRVAAKGLNDRAKTSQEDGTAQKSGQNPQEAAVRKTEDRDGYKREGRKIRNF